MTKPMNLAVLIAGLALAGSSTAAAQTPAQAPSSLFVDINVGAQTQARTLNTSVSFPLYGETAIINAAQAVDGGGLFDISAGYRVWSKLSAAVGFSVFSNSGDGSLVASIPNPNILNRPLTVTSTSTNLNHSEIGTHLMAVWSVPITEEVDAAVFAGPSFFRVTQDILTATVPAGTQTVNVATQEEKGTATGVNIGVNLNYMYKPNYGAGVFLRYAGASVDLPSAGSVKVGGFQLGIGARLRF